MLRYCLFHTIVAREAYTPCATNLHCSSSFVILAFSIVCRTSQWNSGRAPWAMFSCYCLSFSKTVQKPAYSLFWQFDAVLKNKVLCNNRNFKPLLVQAQHLELCVVAHDYLNAANVDNEIFLHYKNKRWLLSVRTSRSHLHVDIVHACMYFPAEVACIKQNSHCKMKQVGRQ